MHTLNIAWVVARISGGHFCVLCRDAVGRFYNIQMLNVRSIRVTLARINPGIAMTSNVLAIFRPLIT